MRRAHLAAAVVAALSLTGCSLLSPGDPASSTGPASDPPPSTGATASASDPSGTTPSDPTSGAPSSGAPSSGRPSSGAPSGGGSGSADPNQFGPVTATRTAALDGEKAALSVYSVTRDGSVSHVNLTLRILNDGRVQVADAFSDGNYDAIDKSGFAADGLQLVDGKNSKLYLVASDGQGQCLCSRDLSGVFADDEPVVISATFANPPADVTTVDLRIPSFGVVTRVPVV
jgi:hypothetical protein